jgi:hypothetical protein
MANLKIIFFILRSAKQSGIYSLVMQHATSDLNPPELNHHSTYR